MPPPWAAARFSVPGGRITVEDLLKRGVCVSSGNDAAVALAEKTAGVTGCLWSR